ncbi:MAG: peptidase C11 [Lachnospiraceae bacterium]|nr:peptidase C11 [Lachnospiraceae bacterium]
MADNQMPRSRDKKVTGKGSVNVHGEGLGTGPVGSTGGTGRKGDGSGGSGYSGGGAPSRGLLGGLLGNLLQGKGLIVIILIAVLVFGGGGGLLSGFFGNLGGLLGGGLNIDTAAGLSSILGGATSFSGSSTSSGWDQSQNTSSLNTSTARGIRSRYYTPVGNGRDTVTVMVYMCGTDLESQHGMASNDLNEMLKASIASNVNLIIYTGGCKGWKTTAISSTNNQIYKIEGGRLVRLEANMGSNKSKPMTSPDTLAEFIQYGQSHYPANRNILILWDHGGGSLSGYGYDENVKGNSMTLAGINTALKKGGMKFDIIGFDTCLMATAENALMLTEYADYMVASEETEPGVGWYYTNWLTMLSNNTSVSSLELGKKIIDDFVDVCAVQCKGQKTTLSLVDLAELETTVPDSLKSFASSTSQMISGDQFKTVATARSSSREFASSNRIDQVDLVDLAGRIGTPEAKNLASVLLSAIKYNRTSSNMTNAYGLSIYFPYQKTSAVDSAVSQYKSIGMDTEYAKCIQQFASMEVGGQAVSGGSGTALPSLFDTLGSLSGTGGSSDLISGVLGNLLGGNLSGISSIADLAFGNKNMAFLQEGLDSEKATRYLADNYFDSSKLTWTRKSGSYVMTLAKDQWALVQDLELNVFYDTGRGYADLGFDNYFQFTADGELVGEYDGSWLAINGQPVAYYYLDTFDNGKEYTITGYVPALVNGQRAELLLVFDNTDPYGRVDGMRYIYKSGETDTVAKNADLADGDVIQFICDLYTYQGDYEDTYRLGTAVTVHVNEAGGNDLRVSDVELENPGKASAMYRFTDIYGTHYWTPEIPG